jgi:AcrR family transcriptional regulator
MAATTARKKAGSGAPADTCAASPMADRILGAAFTAFMEKGYAGTSTLEIATRAKVSKRELYALFSTKQAMFAAGIASRARRMSLPLDLPPAEDGRALAATLVAFGTTLLREATRPEVVSIHRLAAAEASRSPEVGAILTAAGRDPPQQALIRCLARAQSAGLIGDGEPARLAGEFSALLWGDLMMRLMLRVAETPGEAELTRRATAATAALLTLHPAPGRDEA